MIIWITAALPWLIDRAEEFADFLRSIPSFFAPKPTPLGVPYTPLFTGAQCVGEYKFTTRIYQVPDSDPLNVFLIGIGESGIVIAPISSVSIIKYGNGLNYLRIINSVGTIKDISITGRNGNTVNTLIIDYVNFQREGNLADNCGNLANPIPPPAIADDGLFKPTNPNIGDENGTLNPAAIVLSPALPLVLVGAILGGYAAAMAAAQAALSALDAIKKVAEGLDALKNLWEKLKEFLDDWEKNRPKKRDIVRQTYGRIQGDGALDFFPDSNTKFKAIQLDVIVTNIPIGFGRYFGSSSPSRYRFTELGYIAFYSVHQGILETHSIQFKRTSYQIPELAVGFIYHLGLDEQIKAYSFGTFSVEKT